MKRIGLSEIRSGASNETVAGGTEPNVTDHAGPSGPDVIHRLSERTKDVVAVVHRRFATNISNLRETTNRAGDQIIAIATEGCAKGLDRAAGPAVGKSVSVPLAPPVNSKDERCPVTQLRIVILPD
jgi:hypothetical protein